MRWTPLRPLQSAAEREEGRRRPATRRRRPRRAHVTSAAGPARDLRDRRGFLQGSEPMRAEPGQGRRCGVVGLCDRNLDVET